MAINVNLSVSTQKSSFGSLQGELRQAIMCQIPQHVSDKDLTVIKRDLEILRDILERSPNLLNDILAAGAGNDLKKARDHAEAAGLTEEAFQKQGGGIWLAIAVGVAILLYSQEAH